MDSSSTSEFWRGKKVFLTGHTGFKGSWLSLWLQNMGADVKGYSLEPPTNPSLFVEADVASGMENCFADIRDLDALEAAMRDQNPDIVIHMAAQSLVRESYLRPVETYSTNVMGTVNLLQAIHSQSNIKAVVNVTTDKCYENREWCWGYREDDAMGGHDPYSNSKACSELVTASFRRSFYGRSDSPAIASARAGNVIGGGDWSKDRLLPDLLGAFQNGEMVKIRNPHAIRPWQHVLEPISGYLKLAQMLFEEGEKYSEAWNFGPSDEDAKPVSWVVEKMSEMWGEGASWKVDESVQPHEASFLKLDISKAKSKLGWFPRWGLEKALVKVVDWHRAWSEKEHVQRLCIEQIESYTRSTPVDRG